MEQKLANSTSLSINEKKFIENGLLTDLRIDGRRIFDFRDLVIEFGRCAIIFLAFSIYDRIKLDLGLISCCGCREDGEAQVRLGNTRVMAVVTAELVQPYRDRPNEGTLSIFTEFSPMADPSFEAGRPGEFAVEVGRIIDRGLR